MTTHQITLEILDPDQHTGEETRTELARNLQADVGAPRRWRTVRSARRRGFA
jgi:hypothetical protein